MQDERTRSKWRGERGRRKERERVAQSCCVTLRKTCRLVTNSSVIVKHEVVCPSGFSTGAVESPKSYFSTNTHTQSREEFLGGARQLGLESDWREVRERLQQADSGQDRTREGLTETDTVGDVAGRKVRTTCRAGKNTDILHLRSTYTCVTNLSKT